MQADNVSVLSAGSWVQLDLQLLMLWIASAGPGSFYPQGPGHLMRPPRDDSLTFKNRSESRCVGLGQKRSWRKDVPESGLHQFRELKIQPLPQLRPLRCVSESEDTGSVGLEEFAVFCFAASQNLRPPFPCYLQKNCSQIPLWISSGDQPMVQSSALLQPHIWRAAMCKDP
jgi:hypothetical protein